MSILRKNNLSILKSNNNIWWLNKIYLSFWKNINIKYYYWIIFNSFKSKNHLNKIKLYCLFTKRTKAVFKTYLLSRLFLKESFENILYPTIYKGFF